MSQMTEPQKTEQTDRAAGESPFSTIEEAIEEIRAGRMVVVCDGEDRENEGDLVMAAQFATPEADSLTDAEPLASDSTFLPVDPFVMRAFPGMVIFWGSSTARNMVM